MPMLAELVDAVVGVDTHRDTHQVEIALPNGAPIAVTTISNDTTGYAELLAWIVDHAPGPRLAVSIEGTRSYGIGLARAANAAGLLVVECEQPNRKTRRGRGKSDPIDAHLAVLAALRLDADRLPTPRADGDREALRILLTARQELTTSSTAQTNRLRALLLGGDDTDRQLARGRLSEATLASLARRRPPRDASREQAVRHAEIRRLTLALREAARELKAPAPARSRRAAGAPCVTGSTGAGTALSTAPSTPSPPRGCAAARPPRPTSPAAPPRARPPKRSAAASSDTSPASSTAP